MKLRPSQDKLLFHDHCQDNAEFSRGHCQSPGAMDPGLNLNSVSNSGSDVDCPSFSSLHSGRWLHQHEEGEEECDQQLLSFVVALSKLLSQQGRPWCCKRLHWECHACKPNCEGPMKFCGMHQTHCPSFIELCTMIDPFV